MPSKTAQTGVLEAVVGEGSNGDVLAEVDQQMLAVVEEGSWLPGEAGHGGESTLSGLLGCDSGEELEAACKISLDIIEGGKVGR